MSSPPSRFMQRHDWQDWLNQPPLSQTVQPHLIACATPDGVQHWLEDESHPRDVHVAHAALTARKQGHWHRAVYADRRLAALESAFMRMLVSDLLEQPEALVHPADWIVRALTDDLGRAAPAKVILDGDVDTLTTMTAWLSGTDHTGDEETAA